MTKRRDVVIVVVVMLCLAVVLFAAIPTWSSPGVFDYNPWYDVNNDGTIDGGDLIILARAFGTAGTPITKASMQYDSGWMNITGKQGQNITITHNLNITDWNDPNIAVDITGETTPSNQLLRFTGLTSRPGWNRTYGGYNIDVAEALVQTSDGGYALAGYTNSFGFGGVHFYLVKTDASGNMMWNKTYGGTHSDYANALVQTSDGGYALAGYTNSFGAGNNDAWLVKTDSAGNIMWNKTYGGANNDYANALVQTSDGGYALAGYTHSFGAGDDDAWLVKTDASGNMMWNKTYGGAYYDGANALVQASDGGFALGGYTNSFGDPMDDAWLVRTDSAGNMMWNKTYGGTGAEYAYALVRTSDGGYALAGRTTSFGAGAADYWLVKTDSAGNIMWNKTYGGMSEDRAYALVQASDGGYALAGYTTSFGAGNADFWLVRTDSTGNMMWNKTYGGTSADWAWALVQTGDGGFALAGYTDSLGAGNSDCWLVKADVESGLAWVDSSANTIALYRGATDVYWNFVRVQIWRRQ